MVWDDSDEVDGTTRTPRELRMGQSECQMGASLLKIEPQIAPTERPSAPGECE